MDIFNVEYVQLNNCLALLWIKKKKPGTTILVQKFNHSFFNISENKVCEAATDHDEALSKGKSHWT